MPLSDARTRRARQGTDHVADAKPSRPGDFRFVVPAVADPNGSVVHLHNLEITEQLFRTRNSYITEAVGLAWTDLFASGRNLIMRRLAVDFEREASRSDQLVCGVRARWRSRRTLTFEEVLWTSHGDAIARAESVHLAIRTDAPGALELPADIVELFERYEGAPIAIRG